ncbi:hypothetical protein [Cellulomonas persica]|uniref:hypothetical protein n=1 Tax=Cellulomonas persica TaxID=76861 RepID=UPI0011BF50F4|nr:hypothetical protein [Cellulomonas persica]
MRAVTRVCAGVVLAVGLVGGASAGAPAAWASPVVDLGDDDQIALTREDDSYTGTLTVTNPESSAIEVLFTVKGCTADAEPGKVGPGRQESIDLSVSGCELAATTTGTLQVGEEKIPVSFDVTEPADLSVRVVVWPFVVAAALAALALLVVGGRFDDAHRDETGGPTLRSPVAGLSASWSADSWATNITLVSTAVVALFGVAEPLTALLGSEPEQAVAHVLVAGLVASLLTFVSGAVMKAVSAGDDVTVGAAMLGGWLTLTAAAGLLGSVTVALWDTDELRLPVALTCAALVAVAIWYVISTLGGALTTLTPAPPVTADATTALAAVTAVPTNGDPAVWARTVVTYAGALAKELAAPTVGSRLLASQTVAGGTDEPVPPPPVRTAPAFLSRGVQRRSAVL